MRLKTETDFLLPAGTVTLLLADIEGSVRLWETQADEMHQIAVRYDDMVTETIARFGGVRPLEQGEGDSFVAAFSRASDAISCALGLQRSLSKNDWSRDIDLRIGIHTGEVQLRDEGNYVGQAVNRCARLRDIGHGGQTLVSRSTYELVVDKLPDEATLTDLGVHRLRDLARPEHIYQLSHPDLEQKFPALRSLDTVPNNLPLQLTSFIGRKAEIAEVQSLLEKTRMLTLTGSGGCGKTRLALQVAADLLDDYPDGVWLADLAPINNPNLVPKEVASTFGLQEHLFKNFTNTLTQYIGPKTMLMILDNCEHLVSACAQLADTLLHECPSLVLVSTSREPLEVPGEIAWRVPNFPVPEYKEAQGIEALNTYDAVELFVDRALRARPNFQVTNENAPAVAQICQRLDGIPLAIELAAARVRVLTPQLICNGLNDRFHLLTGGGRTVMPRQQTLQASVDWSYALLSDLERIVLARLSVFAGGFTLDAAEKVCSGEGVDEYQVLDLLTGLVDKSLVLVEEESGRYGLLETIRQFGADRLGEFGQADWAKTKHRDFYLALAERAEPELIRANQETWFARLEADHDNLRAALDWSKLRNDSQALLRFAAALLFFWRFHSHMHEGREWMQAALSIAGGAPDALVAKVRWGLGYLAIFLFDLTMLHAIGEENLTESVRLADNKEAARALLLLGWHGQCVSDLAEAKERLTESAALAREMGDTWCLAFALQGLGVAYRHYGDLIEARRHLVEAVSVGTEMGDGYRIQAASGWLGVVASLQGDLLEAREVLERVVEDSRQSEDRYQLSAVLDFLGSALIALGDYQDAKARLEESIAVSDEIGNLAWELSALQHLTLASFYEGKLEEAMSLGKDLLARPEMQLLRFHRSLTLGILAMAELFAGAREAARSHLEESLSLAKEVDHKWGRSLCLMGNGFLARLEGELREAESFFHEALALQQEMPDKARISDSLEGLAGLAAQNESHVEAARLFGSAESLRKVTGYARMAPLAEIREKDISAARNALGDQQFETAWGEGSAMSMDEAISYATRGRGKRRRPTSGWASLTPMELKVAKLVAEGLTNPQIGERLFISKRTVQGHLANIFAKLGISSRSELASEGTRRGI